MRSSRPECSSSARRRRASRGRPGAARQQPDLRSSGAGPRFTDLFIKRPVLAIVVNLVIPIADCSRFARSVSGSIPRSDIAVIRVTGTVYVGANPDLVRGFITTPLERVIASA